MADIEINLETSNPQELVGLGIRAYAIGDFCNAAAAFGRATQLMAEQKGDEHDSLGEIYIHYAKSLLEVSREEATPIGDAIPHGDESSESEEDTEEESSNGTTEKEETMEVDAKKEENKEDDVDKKEENGEKKEDNTEKKEDNVEKREESAEKTQLEDKKEEKKDDKEVQNGEETSEKTTGEEKTNGESSKTDEETAENTEESQENCSDLQLAWEVLEVAKKIFKNRGDAGKEHLAETLILLGEVAMESENFQDGVNDMSAGIELQKELFEPTSRKLASSYYKLGIAHSTISNIEEAVTSFNNSIDILRKRVKLLKESLDEKTDNKTNNKNEEIEEMELLIPEIEEKIADTKSIKEEMAVELIKEMSGSGDNKPKTPPKDEPSSSKPNDISHLVKRKRKANEDVEEPEVQPTKRPTP